MSTAKLPRCTQDDCRGRNVVETDPDDESDDESDEEPVETDAEAEADADPVEDTDADSDDESGGYEPMFSTNQNTADAEPDFSSPSAELDELDDGDDADDGDRGDDEHDGPDPADGENAEDVPEIDPDDLTPIFSSTFAVVDARALTSWQLDDDEAERLGEAWAPLVNKYAPHLFRDRPEEAVAVMCTAAILGPKLAAEQKARKDREARENATDADPGEVREPETVAESTGFELDDAVESDEEQADDQTAGTAFAQA